MHLSRPSCADHADKTARGRPAHYRVVNHDNALSSQHFSHGIVLHFHLRITTGLRGLQKRATDVVISYESELEGQARLLREAQRSGVGRIGNAEYEIGARRGEIARQASP